MHASHIRYVQHDTDCATNRAFLSILSCHPLRFSRMLLHAELHLSCSPPYYLYNILHALNDVRRWREARPENHHPKNDAFHFPRAVAPGYIVECHHTFTAQGHNAATELQFQTTNFALGEWQQPNCLLLRGRGLTSA